MRDPIWYIQIHIFQIIQCEIINYSNKTLSYHTMIYLNQIQKNKIIKPKDVLE